VGEACLHDVIAHVALSAEVHDALGAICHDRLGEIQACCILGELAIQAIAKVVISAYRIKNQASPLTVVFLAACACKYCRATFELTEAVS